MLYNNDLVPVKNFRSLTHHLLCTVFTTYLQVSFIVYLHWKKFTSVQINDVPTYLFFVQLLFIIISDIYVGIIVGPLVIGYIKRRIYLLISVKMFKFFVIFKIFK